VVFPKSAASSPRAPSERRNGSSSLSCGNRDALAGHPPGLVGGEKERNLGHVLGLADPSHRQGEAERLRALGAQARSGFDGGALTSDAGGLLLGGADRKLNLVRWLAGCFRDARDPRFIEHSVATLVGQRVFGIALGYEDPNDHDELRHDPLMAVLAGKLEAWREDCAPVAGKSTLNRLELRVEGRDPSIEFGPLPPSVGHEPNHPRGQLRAACSSINTGQEFPELPLALRRNAPALRQDRAKPIDSEPSKAQRVLGSVANWIDDDRSTRVS
jgi:Transposase DDE domain group 1